MTKLNTGFTDLSNDAIFHLGLSVVHNVGAIPAFASLSAQLPPITTAAGALQAAMELPPGAVREASIAAARTTLSGLLTALAGALQFVPGVTEAELAGSGFMLRHAIMHTTQPPDAPTGLRLKPTAQTGTLQVLLSAVARAVMYEVEYTQDPVNGPWTAVPAYNSTRGIVISESTRGKDYFVHVHAVVSGQTAARGATLPARWRCDAACPPISKMLSR